MDLLKKATFNNSDWAQVICCVIIILATCYIGYMIGKFLWYISQ